MTDTVEALRAQVAELEARLAAQTSIPALPTEHDGQPIEWRRWEPAPVLLCFRSGDLNGCDNCDHPGPEMLTFGLAGPGTPVIRFNAHRCPGCQEMRVYHRKFDQYGRRSLEEIAYSAPRTIARTDRGEASC